MYSGTNDEDPGPFFDLMKFPFYITRDISEFHEMFVQAPENNKCYIKFKKTSHEEYEDTFGV